MRIHWWQSIRWRLAIGSMLVTLLATALLALAVILAINYYYGVDQSNRLSSFAADSAQRIGANFAQSQNLAKASASVFPNVLQQNYQGEQYLVVVLNHRSQPIYPHLGVKRNAFVAFLVALAYPSSNQQSFGSLRPAIANGQRGTTSTGEFSHSGPGVIARPFIVQPVFVDGQSGSPVVGVLVITPLSAAENTIPPFLSAVGGAVFVAAIIVALLSALAAVLFARTITRPLAKLTGAARQLASGDLSTQVTIKSHSELGELASSFNQMVARLESDVNELRRQELLRRELVMNITHDLATPLTAIAGLGESLVDGVNQSREDYEATGRIIVRETLRLRRLVKDLHMMARVEAGALQPQRKPLRLASLVDEVLAVLAPEFERVQVEPRNIVPYDLPIIAVDADMLMRVFSNLFDNALRHTPRGGAVTITAVQDGPRLVISVTDTGEGIPTGALPRVFDRFYRADSARQATTGGSGLGLAIVHAIIEAHGGSIWAENVSDGARFTFSLPFDSSNMDVTSMPTHQLTHSLNADSRGQ